jgi:DNA-binding transcriptional LysR family regulator
MESVCGIQSNQVKIQDMSRDLNVDQIKKLWILDLIIQTGSLKKAALLAKVTPSAVSQALTGLEQAFGKALIIREKGSMRPTLEAQHLLDVIRPAFEAFDKLKDINRQPAPEISWINFGTYESIAVDILPGLIHVFRKKLPQTKLGLRIARTSQLLTMVRKGELCSALIAETDGMERFYSQEVFEDRLGLYVSSRHPIAEAGWDAIEKFGFGSLAPTRDGFPRYYSKFLRQLQPNKPFILCESFETLRSAAAAGSLVAILPQRVGRRTDDLIELHAPKPANLKETGRHRLFVISQLSCDRSETDFLAEETKRLLHRESLEFSTSKS